MQKILIIGDHSGISKTLDLATLNLNCQLLTDYTFVHRSLETSWPDILLFDTEAHISKEAQFLTELIQRNISDNHNQCQILMVTHECTAGEVIKLLKSGIFYIFKSPASPQYVNNILHHIVSAKAAVKPKNILVIEDSKSVRQILINIMHQNQLFVQPLEAENGMMAMKQVTDWREIDLILLDWYMPEMNGYWFTQNIKQIRDAQSIPIIMISTEGATENMQTMLGMGISEYIVKPFEEKGVLNLITKYI